MHRILWLILNNNQVELISTRNKNSWIFGIQKSHSHLNNTCWVAICQAWPVMPWFTVIPDGRGSVTKLQASGGWGIGVAGWDRFWSGTGTPGFCWFLDQAFDFKSIQFCPQLRRVRPFLSPPLLCFSLVMVAMAVPVNERLLDRLPHYAVEPLEPGDSMPPRPPPTQYPVLFGWAASHDLMALAGIQAKCSTLRALVDADEAPKSWSDGMIWRYRDDFWKSPDIICNILEHHFLSFFCRHETITNHNNMVQFCGVDECTSAYSTPNSELVRTLALHKSCQVPSN